MATTKRYFYSNEFYHIILRGIDGKTLFLNDQDYFRMINGMFVFNDKGLIGSSFRHKGCPNDRFERKRKGPLVNIHAFCLMPNHIHFLLEQKVEGGLSKFMLKIGAGYAAFFNNKYKRKGHLFQSRFKSVLIKDDDQLAVIFSYIHTNPVSIIEPNWKEKGIKDFKKVRNFIETYRWSSYADYLGNKNFPNLTKRNFMLQDQNQRAWRNFVEDWLKYKAELFERFFKDKGKDSYLLE